MLILGVPSPSWNTMRSPTPAPRPPRQPKVMKLVFAAMIALRNEQLVAAASSSAAVLTTKVTAPSARSGEAVAPTPAPTRRRGGTGREVDVRIRFTAGTASAYRHAAWLCDATFTIPLIRGIAAGDKSSEQTIRATRCRPAIGARRTGAIAAYAVSPQPFSALPTALTSCAISTWPSEFWNARHALAGWLPSAMPTPVMSSLIETTWLSSRSPVHGGTVAVGVGFAARVGVTVVVAPDTGVCVGVAGAEAVLLAVRLAVAVVELVAAAVRDAVDVALGANVADHVAVDVAVRVRGRGGWDGRPDRLGDAVGVGDASENGAENGEVLAHVRGGGGHVRPAQRPVEGPVAVPGQDRALIDAAFVLRVRVDVDRARGAGSAVQRRTRSARPLR